jgi:hypothetical protein
VVVRKLCEKAPEAARFLATTILEYSDPNSCPQDSIEDSQPELDNNTAQVTKRRRASSKDLSYRPPQPAKANAEKINYLDNSGLAEDGREFQIGVLAQGCVPDGVQPPIQEEGTTVELHEVKSNDDVDASGENVSWLLDQQQSIAQTDSVRETKKTADIRDSIEDAVNKVTQEARAASVSSEAEQWRPASSEYAAQTASLRPAPPDRAPATPVKDGRDDLFSPQTEEIHRGKIPRSLESIRSSASPPMSSPPIEVTSLTDLILEAVRVIHGFSKYHHGLPREVHSRILQTLREDHKEIISVPNLNEWSDGSMWMQVLEAGESENRKVTILNMLEYMGAWEWYDGQVKLAQVTVRTKKDKPVGRRGAAIHVLNRMQVLQTRTEQPGKWIRGVGRLTLGEEGDGSGISPESHDTSVADRVRHSQRKRITMQLSRGNKLCTKLVKELGLGILFRPDIW